MNINTCKILVRKPQRKLRTVWKGREKCFIYPVVDGYHDEWTFMENCLNANGRWNRGAGRKASSRDVLHWKFDTAWPEIWTRSYFVTVLQMIVSDMAQPSCKHVHLYIYTYVYIYWSYVAQFFLEWETFQTKFVEKIKTHILCSLTFFIFVFLKPCCVRDNLERKIIEADNNMAHAYGKLDT